MSFAINNLQVLLVNDRASPEGRRRDESAQDFHLNTAGPVARLDLHQDGLRGFPIDRTSSGAPLGLRVSSPVLRGMGHRAPPSSAQTARRPGGFIARPFQ